MIYPQPSTERQQGRNAMPFRHPSTDVILHEQDQVKHETSNYPTYIEQEAIGAMTDMKERLLTAKNATDEGNTQEIDNMLKLMELVKQLVGPENRYVPPVSQKKLIFVVWGLNLIAGFLAGYLACKLNYLP